MPVFRALIALIFISVGILFAALNRNRVSLDVGFYLIEARLGLLLLATLIVGVLLGGLLLMATVVWPMRREQAQLRKIERVEAPANKEMQP